MAGEFKFSEIDGVGTVTFGRPESAQRLDARGLHRTARLTASLRLRSDLGTLVIRGSGSAFCAGGDSIKPLKSCCTRGPGRTTTS